MVAKFLRFFLVVISQSEDLHWTVPTRIRQEFNLKEKKV
jgi:hypothetical protein